MDTTRIKRFATEARNILKAGIAAKITSLGFDREGNVPERLRPTPLQGGSLWNGQLQTEGFYRQWMSLYHRIQLIGIKDVNEEATYTWFNRLCAIRILQKNNLCQPVLAYADAARTPIIVDEARQGHLPPMKEEERLRLVTLLDDDTKVTDQFAALITAWCHDNPIIDGCFGAIADYTALLLPNNILAEGGFLDLLNRLSSESNDELAQSLPSREGGRLKANHTEFITDDDFRSPELIGWLYQFYIAERKDEVFSKKGKFEADEIPAATQIFTPNWIVKYMVQNTVGRIYLNNNPHETQLQKKWQYLVKPAEKPAPESTLHYDELTDLRVADLACGSGHILNECFDLLYDLYIAEGYSRKEAITNIFRHNLTGIDLDPRAKQLATFALLLKACQKDASFASAECMPNVLTMPICDTYTVKDLMGHFMCAYHLQSPGEKWYEELVTAFGIMKDADSLGSIMLFDVSDETRSLLQEAVTAYDAQPQHEDTFGCLVNGFRIILALTTHYHALVMNPPYMGSGNMNSVLSKYVKDNYAEGKADLATVFVQMSSQRTTRNGMYAFIIPPSWMFLSAFESLRKNIVENQSIESLLHLSRGVFGADFGSVSAVIKNTKQPDARGTYFRLVERTFQEFDQKHLRMLFEQTLADHDFKYRFKDYSKDAESLPSSSDGNKIFYPNVPQNNFEKIPGMPLGYWVSEKIIETFTRNRALSAVCKPTQGLATADNARFLRLWFEVARSRIGFGFENAASAARSQKKWFPCNKGGGQRKWYGNQSEVIDWENDGEAIKAFPGAVIRNEHCYYKPSVAWNMISSGFISFRYFPKGFILNNASNCITDDNLECLLGYLSTPYVAKIATIINPTLNLSNGVVARFPYMIVNEESYKHKVQQNISLSKADWDAHETSWDFRRNELLAVDTETYMDNIDYVAEKHFKETGERICFDPAPPQLESLQWRMEQYKLKWERNFMQLHDNEEELNRQFISIYGLEDELTPDVPLNEITILQQGEINVEGDTLKWNNDVIIKQLISYAVGCMLGRYRLDKPGLHIAHPNPTDEETAPYTVGGEQWEIDDDGIMPLMANDCGFSDNATVRFADFIRITMGADHLVRSLNYAEQCLGKTLEQYFIKDFWKDHKKMYQNRPIYWLFASKKGTFQVIAYMHRMNAYTVERIRAKYLLPFIEHLEAGIGKLDMRRAALSTKETKRLQLLQKQLDECREYHERLQVVAEKAISFDLDDGVVANHAKFGDVVTKLQ